MSSSSSSVLGKRPAEDTLPDAPPSKEAKSTAEPSFAEYQWTHKTRDQHKYLAGKVHFKGDHVDRASLQRHVLRNLNVSVKAKNALGRLPDHQTLDQTLRACQAALRNSKANDAHEAAECFRQFCVTPEFAAMRDAVTNAAVQFVEDAKQAGERKQAYQAARDAYAVACDMLSKLKQQKLNTGTCQLLSREEQSACVCKPSVFCVCYHLVQKK